MQRAAALSQETVQRLLDDTQQLILATMENQQSGRQAVRIRPSIVFLVRAVGASLRAARLILCAGGLSAYRAFVCGGAQECVQYLKQLHDNLYRLAMAGDQEVGSSVGMQMNQQHQGRGAYDAMATARQRQPQAYGQDPRAGVAMHGVMHGHHSGVGMPGQHGVGGMPGGALVGGAIGQPALGGMGAASGGGQGAGPGPMAGVEWAREEANRLVQVPAWAPPPPTTRPRAVLRRLRRRRCAQAVNRLGYHNYDALSKVWPLARAPGRGARASSSWGTGRSERAGAAAAGEFPSGTGARGRAGGCAAPLRNPHRGGGRAQEVGTRSAEEVALYLPKLLERWKRSQEQRVMQARPSVESILIFHFV